MTAFFLKILVNKGAIYVILENSRKNCLNLESRSRLEAWDWKKEILVFVSKPEILKRNYRSRLEARDWKREILVLVSRIEIGFLLHPAHNLSNWLYIHLFRQSLMVLDYSTRVWWYWRRWWLHCPALELFTFLPQCQSRETQIDWTIPLDELYWK